VLDTEGVVSVESPSPLIDSPLSSLPLNELLEPIGKPEKDDSEHKPTEDIECTSERKSIEYVR